MGSVTPNRSRRSDAASASRESACGRSRLQRSSASQCGGRSRRSRASSRPAGVRRLVALLTLLALLLTASTAAASSWKERTAAAVRYLETRAGVESFALVDDRSRIHGFRRGARVPMASLLKAMALVAYLDLPSVRDRGLHDSDRALLGPMIRRSDNAAASTVLRRVGGDRLEALAERAGMLAFRFSWPIWGNSTTCATDQARFFSRIDRLVAA